MPSAAIKTRIPIPPAGAQSAASLNGTAERLTVRQSDVTEALAALRAEGSQFGLIVVAGAPPSNSRGGGVDLMTAGGGVEEFLPSRSRI